jgi:predicted transcriptional regulator
MFDSKRYEREIEDLQSLGMNLFESLTLLYLLESKDPVRAFNVCREIGMDRANVYRTLNSLCSQGLISSSVTRPKMYFIPSSKSAVDVLVQKNKETSERRLAAISNLQKSLSKFQKTVIDDEWFNTYVQIIDGKSDFLYKVKNLVQRSKEVRIIGAIKDVEILYNEGHFDKPRCAHHLCLSHFAPHMLEKYMGLKNVKTVGLPNEDELFFILGDDEVITALDKLQDRMHWGAKTSRTRYINDDGKLAVEFRYGRPPDPHSIRLLATNSRRVVSSYRRLFDYLYSHAIRKS